MWACRSPKGQAKSCCKALQSHHIFPHTDLRGQPTPRPPERDDTSSFEALPTVGAAEVPPSGNHGHAVPALTVILQILQVLEAASAAWTGVKSAGRGGWVGFTDVDPKPLAPSSCPWVPCSIAMATVFLQVLTQSNQSGAQTGAVWRQDTPGELEEDSGHPSHAVVGGIRKAHELREEGVGAAKVLIATVRGRVVVVGGRGARSGAGIVVGVQVVQRQVLATVAPSAQGEVVGVGCGSRARVMFVGDGPRPAPLAHHHSSQLARAGMSKRYSATPHHPPTG
ncbi:hypothetical protein EYF80_000517 [Liparis tanakae]|uniref:Uncharacterized protein n=1 Tax=Liparis tanakae TaxID=230148 RepID=A0A4Z2JG41_9TELE|nr:hypothetical protein EYF80_000517 [Liparis tanakae]